MTRPNRLAATALAAVLLALPAGAHEFVVKPSATTAAADVAIGFSVLSTHVFFEPEEMERPETVAVAWVDAQGSTPVEIAEGPDGLSLAGRVAGTGRTAWLTAHRLGQVWSKTAEGWVEGGRDVAPGAEFTNNYEKFAKVLINAGDAAVATAPVGQRLEIVPLADPAGLAAGEALEVQVLHEGRPVAASVTATFDGFSTRPGTWAYATETAEADDRGPVATIEPWAPGLWMVRAEHRTADTPGIDEHVMRTVMVFEVR